MNVKNISKKLYSIRNVLKSKDFLKFQFNNSKINTNSYSFDFIENKIYTIEKDLSDEKKLEILFSGIDKKAEKVNSLKQITFEDSLTSKKDDPINVKAIELYSKYNMAKEYGINFKLNNHYDQTYIYSTRVVLEDIAKSFNIQLENSNNIGSIVSFYDLLNKIQNKSEIKNIDEVLEVIDFHIKLYLSELEKLEENQETKKKLIDSKCKGLSESRFNFLILGAIIWIALFFSLIYVYYGWDVIEPITYLSMNGMFIIQLLFMTFVGIEPSPNYFYSDHFRSKNMAKLMQKYGYCYNFHKNISKEINVCKVLIKALEGFRKVVRK